MPIDESLSLIHGLGGEHARRLLKEFGSPEAVLAATRDSLKHFVNPSIASAIRKGADEEALARALA